MSKDKTTGFEGTIDFVHTRVHDGKYFRSGHIFLDVAASTTVEFLIDLSASEEYHAELEAFTSGQEGVANLLENVTVGANGTSVTVINLNRHNPTTCTAACFYTPTNATGTTIGEQLLPGSVDRKQASGGSQRSETEWVLAKDKYLLRILNRGATATSIQANVEWYKFDD